MAGFTEANSPFFAGNHGAPVRGGETADEFLGPIIAGAFARGLAEAFDLLAVAGLFLARDGRVLFASKAVEAHLGAGLTLRAGHLLADVADENACLAAFMADVLHSPGKAHAITLSRAGLTLTTMPVPGCNVSANQLLHAIVVLSRPERVTS